MAIEQYNITGMSCAACSARVEKAVSSLPGVTSCSVSLLTNSMGVEGSASEDDIIKAVEKAGYGASKKGAAQTKGNNSKNDDLTDRETPVLVKRLLASLVFLALLMYVSMGHMMFGFPLPGFLVDNPVGIGLVQLILSATVMEINRKFFVNGFRGLVRRSPNMDTLVALGSFAAFGYSAYSLFAMTAAQAAGDFEKAMSYMDEFYFESAAMILALITVGKMLEAHSKGKTTNALKSLMALAPKTATVINNDKEVLVPIEQVKKGDIFVVRPGDSIPVDGIVIDGGSAVDESALTGESIPVDKTEGDSVSAATINRSGFMKCEAVRVGEDTALSHIIKMVSDASATKAPIAKIADRVSGVFVPAVITVAIITVCIWLLLGRDIGFALARGISVLVISCPCSLGLATPVAIMVGNGVGAKNGIMFKTATALENTGKTSIALLDKTGTVTKGEPSVTDIYIASAKDEKELLSYAFSLEKMSEHPLAKAIVKKASENGIQSLEVSDFEVLPGNGLRAKAGSSELAGGNMAYIGEAVVIDSAAKQKAEEYSYDGKTPLFFALDNKLLGIIAVADVIKPESAEAISELKNMGIRVVMLTGDNENTARAIGKQAGVDEVIAGVLPDGKEAVVRKFKKQGRVAMVGDGINDAPALTSADIGIAIGAGTDIAIESADVVLMNSTLSDVPSAVRLSRRTLTNIHENLFWAFIYNILGIPLAAGAFIGLFGWELNPMFGAAAMSLSSFCVVTNALRLNFVNIHSSKHDRLHGRKNNNKNNIKESKIMKKTIIIEGMMCGHCSGRVKSVLEALPEVESAEVSHETGKAEVVLKSEISDDKLKAIVEEQGYKVISIG